MNQYDLLKLSPPEFEQLSRDLLQKAFQVFIESFSGGKDSGIDLRFATTRGATVVVQCKRYAAFPSLFAELKREAEKVKRLGVGRYYLTTTAPLTVGNKRKIVQLFYPLIRDTKDILGREDINNLISQHKEIEQKYYKLWLASSSVLRTLLNSRVYNMSRLDKREIDEATRLYVQNESFDRALQILKTRRVLIISGIPGVGKSTLAKMLVFELLSHGFTELISLTSSPEDAFSILHEGESQVFFYDDFLGRNFLEDRLSKNEDAVLFKLINAIESSNNKVLIMTTREYILRQAQERYERIASPKVDLSKFVLDVSLYTRKVRASILYNHLFFSRIPSARFDDLIVDDRYLQVVSHRNFNPRIIEATVIVFDTSPATSTGLFRFLMSRLDNPEDVWKHAFHNQITPLSRVVLLAIASAGPPILYEDLKEAVDHYLSVSRLESRQPSTSTEFSRSIKELENTFIRLERDRSSRLAVDFLNPSILDFLTQDVRTQPDLALDILHASLFLNQFFHLFSYEKAQWHFASRAFSVDSRSAGRQSRRIVEDFDGLRISTIYKVHYSRPNAFEWREGNRNEIDKLHLCAVNMNLQDDSGLAMFLAERLDRLVTSEDLGSDISAAVDAYRALKDWVTFSATELMENLVRGVEWSSALYGFDTLKEVAPDEYEEFTQRAAVRESLKQLVDDNIDNVEGEWIEGLIEDVKMVGRDFGIDLSHQLSRLESKRSNSDPRASTDMLSQVKQLGVSDDSSDEAIREMFSTLKDRNL